MRLIVRKQEDVYRNFKQGTTKLIFYNICRTIARSTLKNYVFCNTPIYFYVYKLPSGSFLLCMLQFQLIK